MKFNLYYKISFIGLVLFLIICQIGCAKEPFGIDPDSVLHKDSRYIAVLGDIQYYTSNGYLEYYEGSLEWIASHSNQINFIMHTGDVTNNNLVSQWENFYNTTMPYTDIVPFYTCAGNHDYRCSAPDEWNHRDSTRMNEYVGFPSTVAHVEAYYEKGHYENILVRESLFDDDSIYLLILELNPRRQVVNWADSLVKAIPSSNIILITHRYINAEEERITDLQYIIDTLSLTPQCLWENLIYENDNIRCVLCGHVRALSRVLYSTNSVGRIVPQIEFNIQFEPNGGNGLIELWEFNRDDYVYVRIYNTHLNVFENNYLTEFQFRFR